MAPEPPTRNMAPLRYKNKGGKKANNKPQPQTSAWGRGGQSPLPLNINPGTSSGVDLPLWRLGVVVKWGWFLFEKMGIN